MHIKLYVYINYYVVEVYTKFYLMGIRITMI